LLPQKTRDLGVEKMAKATKTKVDILRLGHTTRAWIPMSFCLFKT
jgi:hypothetical protein